MSTSIRTPVRAIFAGMALAVLAGCAGDPDISDIDGFMAEVDARPKGTIEPLPEFLPYQPFAYSAANLRSPFEQPEIVTPIQNSGPKVEPDFTRVKQYLEQFNMGQLKMVGTLSQNSSLFALVQDARGGVHRVQQGDYMGTDHGRIIAINETEVELMEIVSDGTGGWVQRARTVSLGGGEG